MIPVQKNQKLTVQIEDLTYEGMGVAKVDRYPLFIENALLGEVVDVHVLKVGKKFGYAKIEAWQQKSPNRVNVEDKRLLQTGIAPLCHMTYDAQLLFKQQQVKNLVYKAGMDIDVLPTHPSLEVSHYRNKAQVPVRMVNQQLQTGFFKKKSHQFVPMTQFEIQDEAIDKALQIIAEIMNQYGVIAYDENEHRGVLRHIVIRRGHTSGEMMVTLVTRKKKLFQGEQIAEKIAEAIPKVVSVMHNWNPDRTNVILGETYTCLYGKDTIQDDMLGHTFHISAPAFYQVNTPQAEWIYQKALDLAELKPTDVTLDAYCGIGTITLSIAPHVKEVYGVEIVEAAIDDAKKNAQLNHIHNAYFEAGKAEEVIKKWQKQGIQPDVVFVDPPRKGLDEQFIQCVQELAPSRVVYISCNPATLIRDIQRFNNYKATTIQPVDMFPQTTHVECVTVLHHL